MTTLKFYNLFQKINIQFKNLSIIEELDIITKDINDKSSILVPKKYGIVTYKDKTLCDTLITYLEDRIPNIFLHNYSEILKTHAFQFMLGGHYGNIKVNEYDIINTRELIDDTGILVFSHGSHVFNPSNISTKIDCIIDDLKMCQKLGFKGTVIHTGKTNQTCKCITCITQNKSHLHFSEEDILDFETRFELFDFFNKGFIKRLELIIFEYGSVEEFEKEFFKLENLNLKYEKNIFYLLKQEYELNKIGKYSYINRNGKKTNCSYSIPGKKIKYSEELGIKHMKNTIKKILEYTTEDCPLILETPAGKGTELLTEFSDFIRFYRCFKKKNLKICIDTCHVWDSGYNPYEYLTKFHQKYSDSIALVHFNGSQNELGSRKDRHIHPYSIHSKIPIDIIYKVECYCLEHEIPMVMEVKYDI
uniref:AP (Apurinic) endonuclease family 2 n=1 Tax=Pithovirus LCDPAC02 TaxID=2506601 RepID=A0A481YRQ9_9VIRU|nr:MAG: AP (apurinic) endonuclease family 2 [Pithovirus LCDPAC02]